PWRSSCVLLDQGDADGMPRKGLADAHDLPLQLDAARCAHTRAHGLSEPLDVLSGRLPVVDEEVAVHLRDHGTTDAQAPAAGRVDQFPGAVLGRVLECRAAGALLDRLM